MMQVIRCSQKKKKTKPHRLNFLLVSGYVLVSILNDAVSSFSLEQA